MYQMLPSKGEQQKNSHAVQPQDFHPAPPPHAISVTALRVDAEYPTKIGGLPYG